MKKISFVILFLLGAGHAEARHRHHQHHQASSHKRSVHVVAEHKTVWEGSNYGHWVAYSWMSGNRILAEIEVKPVTVWQPERTCK